MFGLGEALCAFGDELDDGVFRTFERIQMKNRRPANARIVSMGRFGAERRLCLYHRQPLIKGACQILGDIYGSSIPGGGFPISVFR